MTFQPCPGIAEAVISYANTAGGTANNVLHYKWTRTADITQDDVNQLAIDVDAVVADQIVDLLHVEANYLETRVKMLDNITPLQHTVATGAASGGNTDTILPSNVSLVITMRTALAGRSARGRLYAPYITAGSGSTLDQVSSAFAASWVAAVNSLLSSPESDGWALCVLSRRTNKTVRAEGVGFLVTDVESRNLAVDSQRGRLIRNH